MVESRHKRATLALGANVRELLGSGWLATLDGASEGSAKLLARAGKKKNVGLLASDIAHLLSAATRMLDADPPSPDLAAALGRVLAAGVGAAGDEHTGAEG
jgi:hypothetical protein